MKIRNVGSNMTELHTALGAVVLFSVGVQVAQDAMAPTHILSPASALTNLQVRFGDAPGVGPFACPPQVVGVVNAI